MKGKVKWFNAEKGYGFINPENNENVDIFVHYSQIIEEGYRSLKEGESVDFILEETDKGSQAHEVKKLIKEK